MGEEQRTHANDHPRPFEVEFPPDELVDLGFSCPEEGESAVLDLVLEPDELESVDGVDTRDVEELCDLGELEVEGDVGDLERTSRRAKRVKEARLVYGRSAM